MIIENISDVLDRLKRYTEKDSPYYGKDLNTLTAQQLSEHQRYIDGSDPKKYAEGLIRMNRAMEEVHRDYVEKSNRSDMGAAECWVDFYGPGCGYSMK